MDGLCGDPDPDDQDRRHQALVLVWSAGGHRSGEQGHDGNVRFRSRCGSADDTRAPLDGEPMVLDRRDDGAVDLSPQSDLDDSASFSPPGDARQHQAKRAQCCSQPAPVLRSASLEHAAGGVSNLDLRFVGLPLQRPRQSVQGAWAGIPRNAPDAVGFRREVLLSGARLSDAAGWWRRRD